jgi:predicted O-methyltransferase YrrM
MRRAGRLGARAVRSLRSATEDRGLVDRRRISSSARYLLQLRVLPLPVAWFAWRARREAGRRGDVFSLTSATRPDDLAILLELADGRRQVVELGTGTGWTSIALAIADENRQVTTYDPIDRPERERYLALIKIEARKRITFVKAPGVVGPTSNQKIDLLYIDSSHGRSATIEELDAWRGALSSGAIVVFDDFTHPDFPGVREAVKELGLRGVQRGTLFVYTL